MPTKKKGPAFDMNSAFSGLFSVPSVEETPVEEVKPVAPIVPEPAVTAVVDVPVQEIPEAAADPVSHRKPADMRTRQYTITLRQGTHEALRDIAWYTRQSVSSILNILADEYIRNHSYELEECRKINRR